jgi:hypothetical protein
MEEDCLVFCRRCVNKRRWQAGRGKGELALGLTENREDRGRVSNDLARQRRDRAVSERGKEQRRQWKKEKI